MKENMKQLPLSGCPSYQFRGSMDKLKTGKVAEIGWACQGNGPVTKNCD